MTLVECHIMYKTFVWGIIAVTLSDWWARIIVTCVIANKKCSWECQSSLWGSRCAAFQSAAALPVCHTDMKEGTRLSHVCGRAAPPSGPTGKCYSKNKNTNSAKNKNKTTKTFTSVCHSNPCWSFADERTLLDMWSVVCVFFLPQSQSHDVW